jgi:F-type H+-transporting ATPase subunit b
MELLKLLSANEIVAQALSFLILLAILRVFLWKRFLKMIDERRRRIASELEEIEGMKGLVSRSREEYEKHLSGIEELTRTMTEEAIAEGKRIAEELKEKAKEDAQHLVENAKESIRAELAEAKEALKEEIVDIALGAADKVLDEKVTEKDDRRLVQDFLKNLGKAP